MRNAEHDYLDALDHVRALLPLTPHDAPAHQAAASYIEQADAVLRASDRMALRTCALARALDRADLPAVDTTLSVSELVDIQAYREERDGAQVRADAWQQWFRVAALAERDPSTARSALARRALVLMTKASRGGTWFSAAPPSIRSAMIAWIIDDVSSMRDLLPGVMYDREVITPEELQALADAWCRTPAPASTPVDPTAFAVMGVCAAKALPEDEHARLIQTAASCPVAWEGAVLCGLAKDVPATREAVVARFLHHIATGQEAGVWWLLELAQLGSLPDGVTADDVETAIPSHLRDNVRVQIRLDRARGRMRR